MIRIFLIVLVSLSLVTCKSDQKSNTNTSKSMFSGKKGEVKLMTLDPGHFHAALIQKSMYEQIDSTVYIFAPEGQDVQDHIHRIEAFNTRSENPTSWKLKVYTGADFFEKMISQKPGNVMVVSGNNAKKTEYIKASIDAGINVFADKPMAINYQDFLLLEEAFKVAQEKNLILYDIMTERYEITTILQRKLSQMPEVFGQLTTGTPERPAITKESVHHFFKYVAGSPLVRPAWYFDVEQQGEGIVDVNTHLVDLIQWEAFPEVVLSKNDVDIISAKHWATKVTPEMFKKVTLLNEYPDYLEKYVKDGDLEIFCNGEINYTLKGIHARASVIWNFQAPEGAKDTHYSIMRGSKCNLIIQQGKNEDYKPVLYIESEEDLGHELKNAVLELSKEYPGLELKPLEEKRWTIEIPEKYSVGHEAHFAQVTEKYLGFLKDGSMPEWEVPNMIVKYYTTTKALELAK